MQDAKAALLRAVRRIANVVSIEAFCDLLVTPTEWVFYSGYDANISSTVWKVL